MATLIKLCDMCANIPFDTEDPPTHAYESSWDIGTLSETRKKTYCPLCRIVIAALFDRTRSYATYCSLDQTLILHWISYTPRRLLFH
jgi:hypothetical protein